MAEPNLWLSESKADQEAAGWRCMACPAISACGEYVLAFPEPSAVWAGMTPSERRRHPRQHPFPGAP
ncbi:MULTISPECIES: WhiB family transcriptional regulator [unclassified Aeromicrobium]|uniref:WhiB family transcriptional regulator n=1 Tax=unclassified Aeromicrobium TaxID=2633570 RepID=UPI00396B27AD